MNENLAFKYHGNVTLYIKKGDIIIKQFKLKNSGFAPLFQFFSYCLAGKYEAAEALRPWKIMAFYNANIQPGQEVTSTEPQIDYSKSCSTFIYLNKPAAPGQKTTNDQKEWVTKLHFIIPYSYISGDKVNQICLYGFNMNNKEIPAAVYYLQELDQATNKNVYKEITISAENKQDYSLIVEWELSVSN